MKIQNFILCLLLAATLMASCQKDQYAYNMYNPTTEEIDSVSFSTSSNTLIADGKATLSFFVETFRRVSLQNALGVTKDSMLLVDQKMLPEGAVKIYANGELLAGNTYSSNTTNLGIITFYAKVGEIETKHATVKLRAPQQIPAAKDISLVFHVFELDPKDAGYNALTYLELNPLFLQATVDKLNDVFNNRFGNDPNGAQMAVKFELAKKNAAGSKLQYPGYNKVVYNSTWKASATATSYTPADFKNKINAIVSMKWDPQKYVNIYIIPLPANTGVGSNVPTYQMKIAGEDPIPGVPNSITDLNAVVGTDFYETYGLGIQRNLFTKDKFQVAEIASYLGKYYGLKSTNVNQVTDTDYCTDTRKYIGSTQVNNLIKLGIDGYRFVANNAMDDVRYPSLRNCFTVDQVNRMQSVLQRSPVRQSYTLQK
ncbi:hypothetical protein [Sphingobacterium sp.]|uniref:hypothetical protein n=1 Tax=Sphingobacterium sp. TaxID=341027 RepID=UPI0031D10CF7